MPIMPRSSTDTEIPHDQLPAMIWVVDSDLQMTKSVGRGTEDSNLTVPTSLWDLFETRDEDDPKIRAHRRALAGETTRYQCDRGERPTEVTLAPVRDAAGAVTAAIAVAVETSEFHDDLTGKGRHATRLETFADQLSHVVWIIEPSLNRLTYVSAAFESIWHRPAADLLEGRLDLEETVVEEDREMFRQAMAAHNRGEAKDIRYRIRRPDGSVRHVRDRGYVVPNEHGDIDCIAGLVEDVTTETRHRGQLSIQHDLLAQIARGESYDAVLRQLCLAIEHEVGNVLCSIMLVERDVLRVLTAPSVPQVALDQLDGLPLGHGSCGAAAATGEPAIVPDTRTDERWAPVREFAETFGIRACWSIPIRDEQGQPCATFAISHLEPRSPDEIDMSLLETAAFVAELAIANDNRKRRQSILLRELDHRVKNNLAIVQSIAQHTARNSTDLGDFLPAFEGRINAISIVHSLLAAAGATAIDLGKLVERITRASAPDPDCVMISGKPVELPGQLAQPLGMTLHEIATNAAKHGAFSQSGGRVNVSWQLCGRLLTIDWTESGGPPVTPPDDSTGIGVTLLHGIVESQLGGRITSAFEPDGVHWTIEIDIVAASAATAETK